MANSGRDTNGSQFYMTVEATPFLDGRCVAFGRITSGLSLAQKAFQVYHARGRPVTPIKIVDSGLVDQ
jgi:cyclophilin family peptidyl-prolyl cis-trans isomerase